MEIVKRILAIVVIVISAIFIAVSAAGIFFSWSFNGPVTETTIKIVTGVERVLTVADTGLERVNTRLGEAQSNVNVLEENIESAGETLSETSLVFEILERTVGDELFPKIESARDTVAAVGGSLVAFNETLEAVNEIPFIEVPTLTEDLEAASDKLAEIRDDVEETRADLREIREESISKRVDNITARTTRISDRLEETQTALTGSQNNIQDNLDSIAETKSRVAGIFDLISSVLTFIFLWIAFGQVGLIVLAWGYVKGPGSDEEGEQVKEQETTENLEAGNDEAASEDEAAGGAIDAQDKD